MRALTLVRTRIPVPASYYINNKSVGNITEKQRKNKD